MSLFDGYIQQLERILGVPFQRGGFHLSIRWDTVDEARERLVRLRLMQKELRMLKKEVSAHKREMRSEYVNQRQSVGLGVGSAVLRGFFGARAAGRANQAERRSLRSAQQSAMQPFEQLINSFDQLALGLDRIKLRLERCITTGTVEPEEDIVDTAEPTPRPQRKVGGWLTLLVLGLVIGIPLSVFLNREKPRKRETTVAASAATPTLRRTSEPRAADVSREREMKLLPVATPPASIPTPIIVAKPTTTVEAQRVALGRYTDLGKAGSAFNAEFLRRHAELKASNPAYLTDPAWPLKLADDVARSQGVLAK